MSSQFPFEGQELPSCQALELWEVLHRAGNTCPVVCAAAWAESGLLLVSWQGKLL